MILIDLSNALIGAIYKEGELLATALTKIDNGYKFDFLLKLFDGVKP